VQAKLVIPIKLILITSADDKGEVSSLSLKMPPIFIPKCKTKLLMP